MSEPPADPPRPRPAPSTPSRPLSRPIPTPPPAPRPRVPLRPDDPDFAILAEAGPGMPPWNGPPPLIEVLHQDDDIIAVSKPPGLLVHRVSGSDERTVLLQTVRDQVGKRLFPVQRLDRPASGVIVFALTSAATPALQERLHDEETRKEYLLLVRGEPPDRFESRRALQGPSGQLQEAWSEFETLARVTAAHAPLALVRGRLRTGRNHQLRRHLAHLGHPVVGDTTYGKVSLDAALREAHALQRIFLHAHRLVLRHPTKDGTLTLVAPLYPDLVAVMKSVGIATAIVGQEAAPPAPPSSPDGS